MKQCYFPGFLLIVLLLAGCMKRPDVSNQSRYTFSNQTGREIFFDIYPGPDEYYSNSNRSEQHVISPGGNLDLQLEIQKTYWIDWYSADFSVNNWQELTSSRASPAPRITVAAEDDVYAVKCFNLDTSRAIVMNGNGAMSVWETTINNNPSLNGTHRFSFKKNFTGIYTYTDPGGASSTQNFKFTQYSSSYSNGHPVSFRLSLSTDQVPNAFYATFNPGYIVTPRTGKDSTLIRFNLVSPSTDYYAVRK